MGVFSFQNVRRKSNPGRAFQQSVRLNIYHIRAHSIALTGFLRVGLVLVWEGSKRALTTARRWLNIGLIRGLCGCWDLAVMLGIRTIGFVFENLA
jgi:hypothetical protein